MRKTTTFVLSLALVAPAAFAGPGADQLALNLGVEPGKYTLSQLVELHAARENGGAAATQIADEILATPGGETYVPAIDASDGLDVAEITLVRSIAEDSDLSEEQIVEGLENDATTSDFGQVTSAKEQLAAPLGVDPAEFTTAELVDLIAERRSAEDTSADG